MEGARFYDVRVLCVDIEQHVWPEPLLRAPAPDRARRDGGPQVDEWRATGGRARDDHVVPTKDRGHRLRREIATENEPAGERRQPRHGSRSRGRASGR